jgi:RepB DNA-primase from phage plasmid
MPHGSHIYIRRSGEQRFTTLDDLNKTSLARLSADGFNPCAVVETSAGNFQAWLKHLRMFPKLLATYRRHWRNGTMLTQRHGLEEVWTASRLYLLQT